MKVHFQRMVEIHRSDALRVPCYDGAYWSANKLNFDCAQMPQRDQKTFTGFIRVIEMDEDVPLEAGSGLIRWSPVQVAEPAGVMETMYAGIHIPRMVADFKTILAPGSIAWYKGAAFCPILLQVGPAVFLGIELLHLENGLPVVPKGANVLALSNVFVKV